MTAPFSPRANLIARASLAVVVLLVAGVGAGSYAYVRSSFMTDVGVHIEQPVPFSHHHHVAGLGIDCRYCHPTVETSPFAGMPTTDTCMNCHAQLWTDAAMLEPLRRSWRTGRPIRWRRVHDLPDFAYFDHSIHVNKGIGCVTCHGQVDEMRLLRKTETLFMQWCLRCHRDPDPFLRPRDEVFNMAWGGVPTAEQPRDLRAENRVRTDGLTNCSTCHR